MPHAWRLDARERKDLEERLETLKRCDERVLKARGVLGKDASKKSYISMIEKSLAKDDEAQARDEKKDRWRRSR